MESIKKDSFDLKFRNIWDLNILDQKKHKFLTSHQNKVTNGLSISEMPMIEMEIKENLINHIFSDTKSKSSHQSFNIKNSFNITKNEKIKKSKTKVEYNNYLIQSIRINELSHPEKPEMKRELCRLQNVFESRSDWSDDDCFNDPNWFILNLDSNFSWVSEKILFYTIIYSLVVSTYLNCFFLNPKNNIILMSLELFSEFVLLCDFFKSFITPYYDREENVQSNLNNIFINNLRSYFLTDLLGGIPISSIIMIFNTFSPLLLKNLRLYFWVKIVIIFKLNKNNSLDKLIELKPFSNVRLKRIIEFLVYFFLSIHVTTCFWIFIGNYGSLDSEGNWISYFDFITKSEIYIASLYFNVLTVYTIGYGDIFSINIIEKIFNSFLLMFGTLLFSYAVSNFSTLLFFDGKDSNEVKKQILEDIKCEYGLSNALYNKCKNFIIKSSENIDEEKHNLLDQLPIKLKCNLIMLMYNKYLNEHEFFKGNSNEFAYHLLPLLRLHKLEKNEKLFSIGENVEEIYLVIRGRLSLEAQFRQGFMEVWQFGLNSHFGEILINDQSPYNLFAKSEVVEVLVLKKNDFLDMKQNINFNEIILRLLNNSLKLLGKIQKKRKLIQEILKIDNDVEGAKLKLRMLSQYLTLRDFDRYFYEGIEFTDEFDFITNGDKKILNKIFDKAKKCRKKSKKNSKIKELNSLMNYEKYEEIHNSPLIIQNDETNNRDLIEVSYPEIKRKSNKTIIEQVEIPLKDNQSIKSDTELLMELKKLDTKYEKKKERNASVNLRRYYLSDYQDKVLKYKTKVKNSDFISPTRGKRVISQIGVESYKKLMKKIDMKENMLNYIKEDNELALKTKMLINDSDHKGMNDKISINRKISTAEKIGFDQIKSMRSKSIYGKFSRNSGEIYNKRSQDNLQVQNGLNSSRFCFEIIPKKTEFIAVLEENFEITNKNSRKFLKSKNDFKNYNLKSSRRKSRRRTIINKSFNYYNIISKKNVIFKQKSHKYEDLEKYEKMIEKLDFFMYQFHSVLSNK